MSVSKTNTNSQQLPSHFEMDETTQTLTIQLNPKYPLDELFYVRCREQIGRLIDSGECREIVFDLSELLVLPSSALGLMVAVSHGPVSVRVINPSPTARDHFLRTGLYQIIEVEPLPQLPAK